MLNFRSFQIHRLEETAESGDFSYKQSYQNTGKIITGYLETATPEFSAIVDGEYGKTFRLFTDDLSADILIGDRCIEVGAEKYDVKGVLKTTDGPGRKLEITLVLAIPQ